MSESEALERWGYKQKGEWMQTSSTLPINTLEKFYLGGEEKEMRQSE